MHFKSTFILIAALLVANFAMAQHEGDESKGDETKPMTDSPASQIPEDRSVAGSHCDVVGSYCESPKSLICVERSIDGVGTKLCVGNWPPRQMGEVCNGDLKLGCAASLTCELGPSVMREIDGRMIDFASGKCRGLLEGEICITNGPNMKSCDIGLMCLPLSDKSYDPNGNILGRCMRAVSSASPTDASIPTPTPTEFPVTTTLTSTSTSCPTPTAKPMIEMVNFAKGQACHVPAYLIACIAGLQ
jgi:hypothetical protein